MIITIIGIVSIFVGFLCVMGAFYSFHRGEDRRLPIALGLLGLVFLTVVPVICAVFFAATSNG
ncbi:Hypothetical protein NG00_02007 [Corynebacterium camporealensis]|uniref:Uncharacterized protein n=1 Tax=Corynebacterium camporealensis TaxID=161896 RepID=A0A0F6R016_9CORY|nr:hypothetical protein [Corynebacterium camporealensis]AKE40178.1 hypothetical protein UL81_11245 [Corynebacterium camporealensis]AVH89245.1 Hypothetical protein NG00_02007 [Corynebacterium camporealensis]MDY5839160.1 hypothetical protein [Corynebacterium camporealensis]